MLVSNRDLQVAVVQILESLTHPKVRGVSY